MGARKGVDRYPRPGERIAPATLAEVLLEQAPKRLVRESGLKLSDLDETVWEKLPSQAITELSEIIVDRVAAGCARRIFDQRHFPKPPPGMKLEDLRLEHRTHLCLAREGFEEQPESLGDQTIGEILAMRSFGPRCLVDLLSALETRLAGDRWLNRQLTAEAELLAGLPDASLARSHDPRFGPLLHAVDVEVDSAQELAERLLGRTQDPPDPAYAIEQLRQLRGRIQSMPDLTLEEELIQIFASTRHERNRQILIGYYGWEDGRRHTLAEIGARYGMTRERTRQICAKLVRKKNPAAILAPVMDRTLAFAEQRLPCAVARLEADLVSAGLTAVGLQLDNVAGAAKLLGRRVPFRTVCVGKAKLAVPPDQVPVVPAIVELASKEVFYHGLTTIQRIDESLSEKFPGQVGRAIVTETLQVVDGFRWLDQPTGWFRLASITKHGLPRAIDKVLSVAGALRVSELRQAVGRNRRMWKEPPPENVLLQFCQQTPGVRIQGDRIISDPPRDWRNTLTGVEAQLVAILNKHGPVMERGALEDLCVASGMNRFSFHAFIACSPVIVQYGHSVYGLLGANASAEDVKAVIARRRAERLPTRVLDGHGWTRDGKVWLSYRLSKAASTYAVVTVPAALKDVVRGKFRLLTDDGRHVGTLAAKDGRAWGLGAFLRRRGARIDAQVLITLDIDKHEAVITVGQEGPVRSATPEARP